MIIHKKEFCKVPTEFGTPESPPLKSMISFEQKNPTLVSYPKFVIQNQNGKRDEIRMHLASSNIQ
jgi:hypothetical protein